MALLNGNKILFTEQRVVEVETGAANLMDMKIISANGVYNAANDGVDGYKSVMVAVIQPYVTITLVNNSGNAVNVYSPNGTNIDKFTIESGSSTSVSVMQNSMIAFDSESGWVGVGDIALASSCSFFVCSSAATLTFV